MFKYNFMQISVSYCPITAFSVPSVSTFHTAEPDWYLTSFSAIMAYMFSFDIAREAVPPICCWSSQDTFGIVMLLFCHPFSYISLPVSRFLPKSCAFWNIPMFHRREAQSYTPEVRSSQAWPHFFACREACTFAL